MVGHSTRKRIAALCCALAIPFAGGALTAQAQQTPTPTETTTPAPSETENPVPNEVPDQSAKRFVISFNEMATVDEAHRMGVINDILTEFGSEGSLIRTAFDGSYIVKLEPEVPAEKVPALRGALESKAEIHTAEIDLFIKNTLPRVRPEAEASASARPNDPDIRRQWHLDGENSANVIKAWELGYTGDGINVGVVDSGITSHPDLNRNVTDGADFITEEWMSHDGDGRDEDPRDAGDWTQDNECGEGIPGWSSTWHGTHVSGIVGAVQNNSSGGSGVAPDSSIVPVRVLGACGGYNSDIADGIAWASGVQGEGVPVNHNPAHVINLSLGSDEYCPSVYQRAIDAANRQGSIILVAAGNENERVSGKAPNNCRGVISVGATGPEGYRANYSNYGGEIAISAPGGNREPEGLDGPTYNEWAGIWSTYNSGRTSPGSSTYAMMDGTSMATPVVSGVVAMMLEANPNLSSSQVERILRETAQPFTEEPNQPEYGNDASKTRNGMGAGIIDARAAVCRAINDGGGHCEE